MYESESKKENRNGQKRRFDPELLKKGLRCDLDQYEMLKRCSYKKDMTEWNEWRKNIRGKDIHLEGACLFGAYLEGADFYGGHLEKANLSEAHLANAELRHAHLEGANLELAHIEGSDLSCANLKDTRLGGSYLVGANLQGTHLKEAVLHYAHMERAYLSEDHVEGEILGVAHLEGGVSGAHLEKADLSHADLKGASLQGANLRSAVLDNINLEEADLKASDISGARFMKSNLRDAIFQGTVVDSSTIIWDCTINKYTDFRSVNLELPRIQPGTKLCLEYNMRRLNWEDWYKEHPKLKWLTKPFWLMSDYGLSTVRIIVTFFALAFIFANIYYHWGRIAPPGIVENLFVDRNGIVVPSWLVPLRTLYFSIVTMTTLGFGDMYANAHSIWGHILLSLQVILGYVLLGALVTRFALLFTAGGPAGKFAKEIKKQK